MRPSNRIALLSAALVAACNDVNAPVPSETALRLRGPAPAASLTAPAVTITFGSGGAVAANGYVEWGVQISNEGGSTVQDADANGERELLVESFILLSSSKQFTVVSVDVEAASAEQPAYITSSGGGTVEVTAPRTVTLNRTGVVTLQLFGVNVRMDNIVIRHDEPCKVLSRADNSFRTLRVHLADPTCGIIEFAENLLPGTIEVAGSALEITRDVTIMGPGADRLGVVPVGTQNDDAFTTLFSVRPGVTARIHGLALRNSIGVLFNLGNTSLTSTLIEGNTGNRSVPTVFNGSGASLRIDGTTVRGNSTDATMAVLTNLGTLEVSNSTFSNNVGGHAIDNWRDATIRNTTLSGDSFVSSWMLDMAFVTIIHDAKNAAELQAGEPTGGLMLRFGGVGGHSRIVGSMLSSCVRTHSDVPISGEYNITPTFAPDPALGVDCFSGGSATNIDAKPSVGSLADNGGATLTHLPKAGGLGIDAIPAANCAVTTDQRGMARPLGAKCDAGAVEVIALAVAADASTLEVDEGSTALNAGTFSGGGVTLSVDVGTIGISPSTPGAWIWSGDAPNGPATIDVTVTATDAAGDKVNATFTVSVTNVVPVVTFGAKSQQDKSDNSGDLPAGGSFVDPGADEWLASVDYGEGRGRSVLPLNPDRAFALQHSYARSGVYTVWVCVHDGTESGCASTEVEVRDLTPPVIDPPVITGTLGAAGWYTSNVTVRWTVKDPESGILSQEGCTPATTIDVDTKDALVKCSAKSEGGEASASVSLKRDASAPSITFEGVRSYTVDQEVSITCKAEDDISGIAKSTCPGASGPAYDFLIGENQLKATAKNGAGLTTESTLTFTVSVTATNLIALTNEFVVDKGFANALTVKLAQGQVGAFVNQVKAQSGKKMLSAAHAAILLRLAAKL